MCRSFGLVFFGQHDLPAHRYGAPRNSRLAIVGLVVLGAACTQEAALRDAGRVAGFSPTLLISTEQLDPSAVGKETVFKVSSLFAIDSGDASAGLAAGFFITLATSEPDSVQVRLVDLESSRVTLFTAVGPPRTPEARSAASAPRAFNDRVRSMLRGGGGVYWPVAGDGGTHGLAHRYAIVIPEDLLRPFGRLELFTAQADDGTPLGAAHIELVDDFFYLVVLGDSVQLGNGLREDDKFSALVTEVIERETGRKVILQRYAQSGARIVPEEGDGICECNCIGEVPKVHTSISTQVDQIERPELVDLVLMGGCINDVGVGTILDLQTPSSDLTELTEQFCGVEMVRLLENVHRTVPQAGIVVTGYYQLIGPESDLFALQTWLETHETESDADVSASAPTDEPGLAEESPTYADHAEDVAALIETLTTRSVVFLEGAHRNLNAAVNAVNAEIDDGPMIAFADPGFGPENALFGPERWLWSMTNDSALFAGLDVDLEFFPEDPLAGLRAYVCPETNVLGELVACLYASVGHPNPLGARAYAIAIINELRELGVLPLVTIHE